MTDRVKGFTVTLENDIRINGVEYIMNAIKMIKGVADVEPSITTYDDHMNRARVMNRFKSKLIEFITELKDIKLN